MSKKEDELIHDAVQSLIGTNTSYSVKRESMTAKQFAELGVVLLGFMDGKAVEKITLCKVPCKTPKYTVHFYDKSATIVDADAKVYSSVR